MNPRLLAALFLAFPALSWGQAATISSLGPSAVRSGNSYVVNYLPGNSPVSALSRSVTAANSGSYVIKDALTISGPAGNLPVSIARSTSSAEVALSIARGLARGAGAIGIGLLAYDLISGMRVRLDDGTLRGDLGTSPTSSVVEQWCITGVLDSAGNYKHCATSAAAAAQKAYDYDYQAREEAHSQPICGYTNSIGVPAVQKLVLDSIHSTGTAYYYSRRVTCNGPTQYFTDQVYGYYTSKKIGTQTIQQCDNGSPVGTDGLCPTGVYSPVSPESVASKLAPKLDIATVQQHLISSASSAVATSPVSITGPASQVGTASQSTTTGPAGTVQTTTTPTYNYTYNGDTITYNTTNNTVTNTTNTSGQTTTTTTTETKPQDQTDLCALHPDSAACAKLGTPTDAEPLPTKNVPVTATPDGRWQPSAGACTRGAITLSTGVTVDLWKPFCDFFSMLRGVIVAGFALAGALVFLRGL